jgi:small-conductance mechanosensitive channel
MEIELSMNILDYNLYGNAVVQWIAAIGVTTGVALLLLLLRRIIIGRLRALRDRGAIGFNDILVGLIESVRLLFMLGVGMYVGTQFLDLSDGMRRIFDHAVFAIILIQVGMWGSSVIVHLIRRTSRLEEYHDPSAQTTLSVLRFTGKLLLWSLILLLILDNIGFDITTLIASLGIGGIAVALAAQNILGDLFASLSIAIDKPFIIGDFIIVDSYMGSVEKIGMRTTHVRSLSGELIIFSNTDLLKSRVRNYKRMKERRIVFSLDIKYGTPYANVEAIPGIVRDIIERDDMARFERGHFHTYKAFSLAYEFVYHVLTPDYGDYMDVQQRINLAIYRTFEQRGIDFAFPTQTIHMHSVGAQKHSVAHKEEYRS